jgi:hypothetical protein
VKSSGSSGLVRASSREKQVLCNQWLSICASSACKVPGHLAPQNRLIYTHSVGVIDASLIYVLERHQTNIAPC